MFSHDVVYAVGVSIAQAGYKTQVLGCRIVPVVATAALARAAYAPLEITGTLQSNQQVAPTPSTSGSRVTAVDGPHFISLGNQFGVKMTGGVVGVTYRIWIAETTEDIIRLSSSFYDWLIPSVAIVDPAEGPIGDPVPLDGIQIAGPDAGGDLRSPAVLPTDPTGAESGIVVRPIDPAEGPSGDVAPDTVIQVGGRDPNDGLLIPATMQLEEQGALETDPLLEVTNIPRQSKTTNVHNDTTDAGSKEVYDAGAGLPYFLFQNTSDTDMWLNWANAAGVNAGYLIEAKGSYESAPNNRVSGIVYVYCSAAGKTFAFQPGFIS